MYTLKKFNVTRLTDSEEKKELYISQGYEIVGGIKIGTEEVDLENMTVKELISYAVKNNIDIGKASTKEGIIKKISAIRAVM